MQGMQIPGQGTKIQHVVGQLSRRTMTRQTCELQQSPCTSMKTQHSQKRKKKTKERIGLSGQGAASATAPHSHAFHQIVPCAAGVFLVP